MTVANTSVYGLVRGRGTLPCLAAGVIPFVFAALSHLGIACSHIKVRVLDNHPQHRTSSRSHSMLALGPLVGVLASVGLTSALSIPPHLEARSVLHARDTVNGSCISAPDDGTTSLVGLCVSKIARGQVSVSHRISIRARRVLTSAVHRRSLRMRSGRIPCASPLRWAPV